PLRIRLETGLQRLEQRPLLLGGELLAFHDSDLHPAPRRLHGSALSSHFSHRTDGTPRFESVPDPDAERQRIDALRDVARAAPTIRPDSSMESIAARGPAEWIRRLGRSAEPATARSRDPVRSRGGGPRHR